MSKVRYIFVLFTTLKWTGSVYAYKLNEMDISDLAKIKLNPNKQQMQPEKI